MSDRREYAVVQDQRSWRTALRGAGMLLAVGVLATAAPIWASIPEPSHVIYGRPMSSGVAVTSGTVTLELEGSTDTIASYEIGSDPALVGLYALRVPLDSVGNRVPGTARTGDRAVILLDGTPAGEVVIGERGAAQSLDVDPNKSTTPVLFINDVAVLEGDSGTTQAIFTISLSRPTDVDVDVSWATADGSAVHGSDFAAGSGVAHIAAGNSSTTVSVAVTGDVTIEPDENFFVNLSSPVNASILDTQGKGTILDDDTPPLISISNVNTTEPASGSIPAIFRVSLSHTWKQPVSVSYATANGTATAGSDYTSASGTVIVPTGQLVATLTVDVLADGVDEADETFFVNLASPVNGTILTGHGQGIISDNHNFLVFLEQEKNGVTAAGLDAASSVAVSPDGAHVYATGYAGNGVAVFSRDAANGELDFLQAAVNGADGVSGLSGATSVAVSPDGAHVYVAAYSGNDIAIFGRDTDTGSLTYGQLSFIGTVSSANMIHPTVVACDPDPDGSDPETGGNQVYVVSQGNGAVPAAVSVFRRNAVSGALTLIETEQEGVDDVTDGGGAVSGLAGAEGLAVSPDAAHLYVAGAQNHTLAVFGRTTDSGDPNFGRLSFIEVHQDGVGGVDGLAEASAVTVSPDGKHVYVAGYGDNGIAEFERNTDSGSAEYGELLFLGTVLETDSGVEGLIGVRSLEVTPAGDYLYAASQLDNTVVVFSRNAISGALTFVEVKRQGIGGVGGLDGAFDLAVSPDDQNVYVASYYGDDVAVFRRDLTPPTNPTVLTSTSHTAGVWSNDPTVDVTWSGATDDDSGVAGYSVLFDHNASTLPDKVLEVAHVTDPHNFTGPALGGGIDSYFHLRTCDRSGNCTTTALHLGPFWIDLTPPANPATVGSTSHVVSPPGSPSPVTRIEMTWSAASDAASGVDGFAYKFTQTTAATCSHVENLPGSATGVLGPPLPNGTWYFHLCTRDVAGNWSADITPAGPYTIQTVDDVSPAVDVLSSTGAPDSGEITVGQQLNLAVTQLVLHFSESMANPAGDTDLTDVTNPDNYQLLGSGPNGTFQTTVCGAPQGDDTLVEVAEVRYDLSSHSAAVGYGDPGTLGRDYPGLPAGSYRLIACATLTDSSGNPLDGDGNGTGGDDFVRDFSVLADNLLLNPNFDRDMSFWAPIPAATPEVAYATEDSDGSFASGSAHLEKGSSEDLFAVYQCVDLIAGTTPFQLRGKARVTSDLAGDPVADGAVYFYDVPNCGSGVVPAPAPVDSATTAQTGATAAPGTWVTLATSGTQPGAAISALVVFSVRNTSATALVGQFDDLQFGANTSQIFTSGFETGTTSEWSSTFP